MPRSKPPGWPRYMEAKRLSNGAVAYFWNLPTWARKAGVPMRSEPLGNDYAEAKRRCDDLLNPQLDAWRTGADVREPAERRVPGTFDWMVAVYKSTKRYSGKSVKTRKSYDSVLHLVSSHILKDGRSFGKLALISITPGAADKLFEKLRINDEGRERNRTAVLAMRICKLAWDQARRHKPEFVPLTNPFADMRLSHEAQPTRPGTFDELIRFVAAADEAGEAAISTAAMIAFFWLQRQVDILGRLAWSLYRPADAPDTVKIFHHKTGVLVDVPLVDTDGTELFPELTARLDAAPRRGALIVTRDTPDRRKKVHLPWGEDYFRHRVAKIRAAAGIDSSVKFMGLRHGGNTEAADAGLTDAQMRALSGHKTNAALLRYARPTVEQRRIGARKRLNARTKGGGLSE